MDATASGSRAPSIQRGVQASKGRPPPARWENVENSFVVGKVYYFESMEELAQILTDAGFVVRIGHWALRIDDMARDFELGYVGNITPDAPFGVEGHGYGFPVEAVAANCARLADCLRRNGIGYDFAHVSGDQERELGMYAFMPEQE